MKKKTKITLANAIIVLCVVVATIITATILLEYHRLNEPIPAGVLSALLGLWGGELLIIALRQIFGSDVIKRSNDQDRKDENLP